MAYAATKWSTIRERLKGRTERVPFYEDTAYLAAFNEGLAVFNLLTGRFRRRETLTTVAGQYLYTLSASMLYRTRFEISQQPMVSSSREDLNNARPNWRSETTTTGGAVPTRPLCWIPISLRTVYIWPADAAGGLTLTIDGVSATPVLVEDGDTLNLGDEHLNILCGYTIHALSFSKGGTAFSDTLPLWKAFLVACAEENDQLKTSIFFRRLAGLDLRGLKPLRTGGAPARSLIQQVS